MFVGLCLWNGVLCVCVGHDLLWVWCWRISMLASVHGTWHEEREEEESLGVLLVTIRVVLAELVAILVLVSVQAQLSVDHW